MTSLRRTGVALTSALLLGALSACGGDGVERYCEEVSEQQLALTEAAASGATGLLEALPSFEALRAESPSDIAADWAVVVQRVSVLEEALADADVDPATYDPENPSDDLSDEDQAAIAAAASGLVTPAMVEALGRVQQQARDVCKTPLSL
ncbi:hypothetical protein [Nocardioides sp.]|uniref:hypothetical protein n=1 Tax=Nocardioides sp. TaxID=35761 RepID=UPI002B27BAF1|nr:hypothetical protein [Nocardioides sp.]